MRGRAVRGALAAALVLPLATCTLGGDLEVQPDGTVVVDVEVSYAEDSPEAALGLCDPARASAEYGLYATSRPAQLGDIACHLRGRTRAVDQAVLFGEVVTSEDFVFARSAADRYDRDWSPLTRVDLTVTFPGEVIASNGSGRVSGRTLTVTDPALVTEMGVAATARARPGPSSWVVAVLAGLGWGVVAGLALVWLRGWLDSDDHRPVEGPDA